MKISETKITDIKTLSDAVIEANKHFGGQVWWRGQGDASWLLKPFVFRITDHGAKYEDNIIRRFQQRAPARYPNTPALNDYFGWLFLMQHYRLPTRLLDWTESPLYATYFAAEDKKIETSDGSLYALKPYVLNEKQIGKYGVWMPDNEKGFNIIKKAFGLSNEDVDFVLAISPPEIDIRITAQLSAFTIHGSGKSINDLPDNDSYLIKFIIPANSKPLLLEQLKYLGVRESNLFPDLEHLANEIRSLVFKDDIDEIKNKTSVEAKKWVSGDPPISLNSST